MPPPREPAVLLMKVVLITASVFQLSMAPPLPPLLLPIRLLLMMVNAPKLEIAGPVFAVKMLSVTVMVLPGLFWMAPELLLVKELAIMVKFAPALEFKIATLLLPSKVPLMTVMFASGPKLKRPPPPLREAMLLIKAL